MNLGVVSIKKLEEKDADNVHKFLARTFYKDEPLHGGHPPPPIEDYWVLKALPQGYSLKVTDADGNIVGVSINMDYDKLPAPPKPDTEELQKVDELMELVFGKIDDIQDLLDIHILAVDPLWRKRGLAGYLCDHTERIAKENGFKAVSILSTSIFSAKIAESRGYRCRYKIRYDRYLDADGKPIFNVPPPHTAVAIYVKILDDSYYCGSP
ncbi:hypothetical protein O3M35_002880 [Rhynocoris fuscipes]|uniref:aralkylamine N-acetyltransferase n=1 Tax=Rhynocoris fuscipes TaxID=488301 RepID=A0AAW1CTT2_9HEMI